MLYISKFYNILHQLYLKLKKGTHILYVFNFINFYYKQKLQYVLVSLICNGLEILRTTLVLHHRSFEKHCSAWQLALTSHEKSQK